MKGKRFTDEQITYALRQAEGGTPVADVCRQLGVSEASFYLWKKKYGKLGMTEIRELRQLRDENARLKRLVADLTLDKHILCEVVKKKSEAGTTSCAGPVDSGALSVSVRNASRLAQFSPEVGIAGATPGIRVHCACGSGRSHMPGRASGTCVST